MATAAVRWHVTLGAALLVACAGPHGALAPSPTQWASPLGRDHPLVGRVWEVKKGAFVSEDEMFRALASATFVGLGEQHDNADHHLFQARVIAGLTSAGRAPGVVFEMLDRDEESAARRALEAHPRDPDAVSEAVDWAHSGWPPWTLYRPVFQAAVTKDLPLFAAGIDRKNAMRLAVEGASAAPPELVRGYALDQPLPDAAQESLRAEMRDAHCGLLPDSMLDGMVFVQRVRDATLADGLERSGKDRGGVLIAGNGHVRRDRGVPSLLARRTGAGFITVGLLEVQKGWSRPGDYARTFGAPALPFDFVVFTPRASDEDHCVEIRKKHGAASG